MDDYNDIFDRSVEDDYGAEHEELKTYTYEEFKENPSIAGGMSLFVYGDEEEDTRTPAEKALGIEKKKEEPKKRTISDRLKEELMKPHKYTEKEIQKFKEEAKNTLVRDWITDDPYHKSEEQKAEEDELRSIRAKLGGLKSIYYKPEQFIEAMRIVMEAWNIYARNQVLYSYDEFMKRVAEGKIISGDIIEPRLKYIHRYSIDRLAMFIANPQMDPRDFIPKENVKSIIEYLRDDDVDERFNEYYEEFMNAVEDQNDLTPEEMDIAREHAEEYASGRIRGERLKRLISPDLIQKIIDYENSSERMQFGYLPNKYIKAYNDKSASIFSKRTSPKLKKKDKELSKDFNAIFKRVEAGERNGYTSYSTAAFLSSKFIPRDHHRNTGLPFLARNKWEEELNDIRFEYFMMNMHPSDEPNKTFARRYAGEIVKYLEDEGVNVTDISRTLYGIDSTDSPDRERMRVQRVNNRKNEKKVLEKVIGLTKDKRVMKLVAQREEDLAEYNDDTETYEDM